MKKFNKLFNIHIYKYNIYTNSIITSKITYINKYIVINTFLKSEGFIPIDEFINNNKLYIYIGCKITVFIENLENKNLTIKISREKTKKIKTWQNLKLKYKSNNIIVGKIYSKVKGGFTIKLGIVKAFLPKSLIHNKLLFKSNNIKNKKLKFKIIKLEKKKNNIVLSQRFILEEKNSKNLKKILNQITEKSTLIGIVKNITNYGVFIDLGGFDGLLHITDMSWKRIKHPSDLVKLGNKIKIKILKFDKKTNKISLGLKQLYIDPWVNINNKYIIGSHVIGKVTNITDYGCFVEIENGIEGLVHISEMDWVNKNVNPYKMVKLNMKIKVAILDINKDKRRISLGLKQCTNNPWNFFLKKFNIGSTILGKIKSITDFGIFLGLIRGIDGLVHLSDISWNKFNDDILYKYKKNQLIKVIILGIDIARERVSLGIKQLIIKNR